MAVLVAAYAPGTTPFAVGQAAFTVTIVILFNLLDPVGWRVGELRIEDVAVGCGVSVLVGALFWPRGVASLVGDDLGDAYRTGAEYLREAVHWVSGRRREQPAGGRAALIAGERLDDAVRGFLSEQGTKHIAMEDLWRLIGGTLRLRLTAHAVAGLPRDCANAAAPGVSAVADHADRLVAFYEQLASHVGAARRPGAGPLRAPDAAGDGAARVADSRQAIWLDELLERLLDNTRALVEPADHVAEVRRRPWWR